MTNKINKSLILVAAAGKSMEPVTEILPKYLMDVAGQTMIDRWFQLCQDAGIEKAVVNTFHFADSIKDHIEVYSKRNFSLDIEVIKEDNLRGTGNSILSLLDKFGDEPFMTILGDRLLLNSTHSTLKIMKDIWNPEEMDVLILLTSTVNSYGLSSDELTGRYNVHPTGLVEHKEEGTITPYVFGDIAIFNPKYLKTFSNQENISWRAIVSQAIQDKKVHGVVNEGEWFRLNTLDRYRVANDFMYGRYSGKITRF